MGGREWGQEVKAKRESVLMVVVVLVKVTVRKRTISRLTGGSHEYITVPGILLQGWLSAHAEKDWPADEGMDA